MSEEELKAIEDSYKEARKKTEPHRCPWMWSAAVHITPLVTEVRRLRAERERLACLMSGIDWRALPDNYKHNLQRAEETAAEALALLEERVDMHRELELENEKLQAENAAIRAGLLALAEREEAKG